MKRVRRRWHRHGRLHWYIGTYGPYGYGLSSTSGRASVQVCVGPVYAIWHRRSRHSHAI